MKLFLLSCLGFAIMSNVANSSDSNGVCGNFATNSQRQACEIGYQAGRSDAGSEGMKISDIQRSRLGGIMILPNGTPGSEGHRVIGIPGTDGFEVDQFPLLSEWLKTYGVDSQLQVYAAETIRSHTATEVVKSPFQFQLENNNIKELNYLKKDSWNTDNTVKFNYSPILKEFAGQAMK